MIQHRNQDGRAGGERTSVQAKAPIATLPTSLGLQASAGNMAVVQMLRQANHPWAQDTHRHGPACGHTSEGAHVQRSAQSEVVAQRVRQDEMHSRENNYPQAALADNTPSGQKALLDEAMSSPSSPLPEPLRAAAESYFGNRSISHTRLHGNPVAQRAVAALGAQAITVGHHIFAPPEVVGNMRVMGHELSHVNENLNGTTETGINNGAGLTVTRPEQLSEQKADRDGVFFAAGAATAPSVVAQRATAQSTGPSAGAGGQTTAGTSTVQRAPSGYSGYDQEMDYEPSSSASPSVSYSSMPSHYYAGMQLGDPEDGGRSQAPAYSYGSMAPAPQIIDAAPGPSSSRLRRSESSRRHSESSRYARPHGVSKSSQPPSDNTRELLAIGGRIMREVRSTLHRGAANQIRSAAAAGGGLQQLLNTVRDDRYVLQRPQNLEQRLGQIAAAASALGVGNCGEHAALTFCLLNKAKLPSGVRIWHVSMQIDHAYVAVGRPSNPHTIVVLDAWQNESTPKLARDFNFPFLIDGKITPEATPFRPDGRDYLQFGRQTVDIAAMTQQNMDVTGPAIDQSVYLGQPGMYDHSMPHGESANPPRPAHRQLRERDRQVAAMWQRYMRDGGHGHR